MKFDERAWNIKTQKEAVHGEGGGGTQSTEAPPERGTFYQAS